MRQVLVSHGVSADPIEVIDAIWSGNEWSRRWRAIKHIDVEYDDGLHQIVGITLDWYGKETKMGIARFRTGPDFIEFFCHQPPQPLTHQSGSWAIKRNNECQNLLVATRRIALSRQPHESNLELERRLDDYANKLRQRLSLIVSQFAASER